jgi:hypothetical protein
MPTLLEWIRETHQGPEPRVLTHDVKVILREIIRPDDEDSGRSVALIAERAGVSTRTIYRILNPAPRDDGQPPSISLDLADRCMLACGAHLNRARLLWPDGGITPYEDLGYPYA